MDIQDILNSTSTEPLTKDEILILTRHGYVISKDSPKRVREAPLLVRYNLSYNLDDVDFDAIDFNNPNIIEILINWEYEHKVDFMIRAKKEGLNVSQLDPNGFFDMVLKHPHGRALGSLITNSNPKDPFQASIAPSTWIDQFNEEEMAIAVESIIHFDVPIHRLPSSLLENEEFLRRYARETSHGIEQIDVDILVHDRFDPSLEKDFAKSFGDQYQTIEEIIPIIEAEGLEGKAKALSAMKLFALKYLHKNGIDYVDIHLASDNFLDLAHFDPANKCIMVSTSAIRGPIRDFVYAMLHESNHAIQIHAVENLDYESDPDIDLYIKDLFLAEMDMTYYEMNYNQTSYEADSDSRARLGTFTTLEGEGKLYERLKGETLSKYSQVREVVKTIPSPVEYTYSLLRIDKNEEQTTLDDLVAKVIDEKIAEEGFEKFYSYLQNKFPLPCLEYEITPSGTRKKSPEQLVSGACLADNDKEKGLYEYLIRSSISSRKNVRAFNYLNGYYGLLEKDLTPEERNIIERNTSNFGNEPYVEKINRSIR